MIQYKKIERNNAQQAQGNCMAIAVLGEVVSARELAQQVEKEVGIPAIRTMSVLAAFSEALVRNIEEGRPVYLEGIGTIRPALAFENGAPMVKKLMVSATSALKDRLRCIVLQETDD